MTETTPAPDGTPVTIRIDGEPVTVTDGDTLLDACRSAGIDTPTICYGDTLTPVNACRACVVEVDGNRTLVPACSRPAEDGMVVHTDSERVRHSRKMVLEFLAGSVDLSQAAELARWITTYGADPSRYGAAAAGWTTHRRSRTICSSGPTSSACSATSASRRAATTPSAPMPSPSPDGGSRPASRPSSTSTLPDSACVYCGNCIGGLPHQRTPVHQRVRAAGPRELATRRADGDHHRVLVLRGRLQPRAARPGQRDRQGHLARSTTT